ncbi:integral membrane protein homolog [Streptococcus intermedius JTH08]|nr:integral membrane protein homolog [Streptococcus intermedius JTH08]
MDFSCCFVSSWYANVYTRCEMTDKMREEKEQLDLVMGKILRVGILLSLIFMFLGLIFYFFSGQQVISLGNLEQFNPVDYVKSHSIFDAVTFMLLGSFMLILTPIFRVISTFIIFFKTKDKMYMMFTAIVMIIILVSIILGFIIEPK